MDVSNIDDNDEDDQNEVNPITGSVKPEEFEIDNENQLWCVLLRVREELQWLTREGYEFTESDMLEAIFLVTEVAAIMRVDLGDLLESVVCHFRCAIEDDIHDNNAKMPKRLRLGPLFSTKNYEGLEIER
jgi:hypothetical protein